LKLKKAIKIFTFTLLTIIILLIATTFLVFKSPPFQTWITHYISKQITKDSKIIIDIQSVDISFFNKLILNNVYVQDLSGDTLFNVKQLTGTLSDIDFEKQKIYINTISLNNLFFQLKNDSVEMNIIPFINLFMPEKTDTTPTKQWLVFAKNIKILNSQFIYKSFDAEKLSFGLNYWDLNINKINLSIKNINLFNDSLTFDISELSATEKCGIFLKDLSGKCFINDTLIKVRNLKINTNTTTADVNYYSMKYSEFPSFLDYNNKVEMEASVKSATVDFKDISYFAPALKGFDLIINASGKYIGTVNNFKGKDFNISFGNSSKIACNFKAIGLPEYEETFIFLDIDSLITNKTDIEKIKLFPFTENNYIALPKQIATLGKIFYAGNFTGLYNDFVAYGKINTNLGNISTDISLKKQPNSEITKFNGIINTSNFNLGKILDLQKNIGYISLNSKINGYIKPDSIIAKTKANITSLLANNYTYKGISIDGNINNKKFDGLIEIRDTNLTLDFLGLFDFNGKDAKMNFTADVKKSNLYKLHIYKKDTISKLSFKLVSQYTGLDIDKITGNINIFDINFETTNKITSIKDIRFSSRKTEEIMQANLNSDFLDAEISGKYRLVELFSSIKNIATKHISALENSTATKSNFTNNIKFNFTFKNTKEILGFFIDDSEISYGSTIKGVLNSKENSIKIITKIGYISLGKTKINEINSYIHTTNDSILVYLKSSSINLLNNYELKNLTLEANTANNSTDTHLTWDNKTKKQNIGDIFTQLDFTKQDKNIILNFNFIPSMAVINDSTWYINDFSGNINSSKIRINNLIINKQQEYLFVNGIISNNPEDSLKIIVNDLSLKHLTSYLNNENLNFAGLVNGEIILKDAYNNALFNSNFTVTNLMFNNNNMGNTSIYSKYIMSSNKIEINANSNNNGLNLISLNGFYNIDTKRMNFKFTTNKLLTKIIEPFVKDYTTELSGLLYSNIDISGTLEKPKFEGYILPIKSSLKVNYLNTKYSFSDTIFVSKNSIDFKNFIINDAEANQGFISGNITHNYLKDFKFNIRLDFQNFLSLNTNEKQNDIFYGKSYASGIMKLNGTTELLDFYLAAKTEKNTNISIPLSNPEEISDNNFINFVSTKTETTQKDKYKVNTSGINMTFDLEFNTNAELQIIFDEKIGDIIKVRGNGNIYMSVNKDGNFKINGEYFVSQGTYLFTLQNILNKKFTIQPGGFIKWTGDVYSATTNIDAIYNLKASPYNLTLNAEDKPRIPVECKLNLSNKLLSPDINFGLTVPKASDRLTNIISNLTDDELNRQILFLLITNNFFTNQDLLASNEYQQTSGNAIGKSSGELLSNQLSNWLSKISDDFDIGVKYRPGDEISRDEVELALSTQILNDRVIINSNLGFGEYQTRNASTNSVAGNVNIEYMVNKSGSLRAKGFNQVNDNATYKNSLYTQGVGVFYKEEFNSMADLKLKYFNTLKAILKKQYDK